MGTSKEETLKKLIRKFGLPETSTWEDISDYSRSWEDIRNRNQSPKKFWRDGVPMFLADLFIFLAGFLTLSPPGFYGFGRELINAGYGIFPLVFLISVIAAVGGAIMMLASSCNTE